MKKIIFIMLCVSMLFWTLPFPGFALPVPIDLRTWNQEGPLHNGNWRVSEDGTSVLQTINSNPTLFMSPQELNDTRITGRVKVLTKEDNDWFGFVWGFQDTSEYYLLDWKQKKQSGAYPGVVFSHISNGTVPWGGHHVSQPNLGYEVLERHLEIGGWGDYYTYEFIMDYTSTAMHVDINLLLAHERREVLSFSVGGNFPSGRFGFFNYSQEYVKYEGFTEQAICPGAVSQPISISLFTDEFSLKDEDVRRDPSTLFVACGLAEDVTAVSRPPALVKLTDMGVDLRFEVSEADGKATAVVLDSVDDELRFAILDPISLDAVDAVVVQRAENWKKAHPGTMLEFGANRVIVFQSRFEEFWAIQLYTLPGIQPLDLMVKDFQHCQEGSLTPEVSSVPEPSSIILLSIGLVSLFGVICRLRKTRRML